MDVYIVNHVYRFMQSKPEVFEALFIFVFQSIPMNPGGELTWKECTASQA